MTTPIHHHTPRPGGSTPTDSVQGTQKQLVPGKGADVRRDWKKEIQAGALAKVGEYLTQAEIDHMNSAMGTR